MDGKKRILLKGGSNPDQQEPLNEVWASMLMRRLNIPHVSYTLTEIDDFPMSLCENFITTETELVSAWHIFSTGKKRQNHVSIYEHFLNTCETLGIPNMRKYVDKILVIDFLIANTDRHFGNFGAIRSANTLEWLGASPIFDCGTSMWHNEFTHNIRYDEDIKCKPFKTYFSEQIKLVNSFDWINFDALKSLPIKTHNFLNGSPGLDLMYVDDFCSAIIVVLDNDYFGRLNLGTGKLISTKKAAEIIRDYVHSSSAIESVDISEYAPNIAMDSSLAQDVLNWSALVQFEDGVKRLIEFPNSK